jgi:hypothetical protein
MTATTTPIRTSPCMPRYPPKTRTVVGWRTRWQRRRGRSPFLFSDAKEAVEASQNRVCHSVAKHFPVADRSDAVPVVADPGHVGGVNIVGTGEDAHTIRPDAGASADDMPPKRNGTKSASLFAQTLGSEKFREMSRRLLHRQIAKNCNSHGVDRCEIVRDCGQQVSRMTPLKAG